jgi:hypothetical protein
VRRTQRHLTACDRCPPWKPPGARIIRPARGEQEEFRAQGDLQAVQGFHTIGGLETLTAVGAAEQIHERIPIEFSGLPNARSFDQAETLFMFGQHRLTAIAFDKPALDERAQFGQIIRRGQCHHQKARRAEHASAFGGVAPTVE